MRNILDVHSKHYGKCGGGAGDDDPRIIILPSRILGKTQRVCFNWESYVQPS